MAKSFIWSKKWFSVPPTPARTNNTESPTPPRGPLIKKHRSFFNLSAFATNRPSSLHDWTESKATRIGTNCPSCIAEDTQIASRTIYYNSPRFHSSTSQLLEAATTSDTAIHTTKASGENQLLSEKKLPPRPPLVDRYNQSRQRSFSLSSTFIPQHPYGQSIHNQTFSDRTPHTVPTLPRVNSEKTAVRPGTPTPTTHSSQCDNEQMMHMLNSLAGSVDDLSRKVASILALSGKDTRDNSEKSTTSLVNGVGDTPVTTSTNNLTPPGGTQSHGYSSTSKPLRPRPQALRLVEAKERCQELYEEQLSPVIPPHSTSKALSRFDSIPLSPNDTLVQEAADRPPLPPRALEASSNDGSDELIYGAYSWEDGESSTSSAAPMSPITMMLPALPERNRREVDHSQSIIDTSYPHTELGNLHICADSGESSQCDHQGPVVELSDVPELQRNQTSSSISTILAPSSSSPRLFQRPRRPPPPPPPPALPPLSPISRPPAIPARPNSSDLAHFLPMIQARIAILEHEWPELFLIDHKPSPELCRRLEFLLTLIHSSFKRDGSN
ncbi:hypothetical protein BGZ94_000861, partial [Podila epigama]